MGFSVKTLNDVGLAQSFPLVHLFLHAFSENLTKKQCLTPPSRCHHVVDTKKVKPKTF